MTKFLDTMMQFQTSLPTTKATSYYLHLGHLSIIQSDPIHSNNLRFSQATFICSMAVHSTTSRRAPDARGQRRPRRGRDAGCGWCNGCGHRSIRSLAESHWQETKTPGIWWDKVGIKTFMWYKSCYPVTVIPKNEDSKARWKNVKKIGLQINDGHDGPKSTWTGLFFGAAPNNLILSAADGGRCMGKWLDKDPAQPTCMFVFNNIYIYCHMLVAAVNFKGSCVEAITEASTVANHRALSCQMKPQILGRTWGLHPNSQDFWWLILWRWLNICNSRVLFMKLPSQALLWWFPHQLLQLIQRQNRMCPIDPCFCTKEPEMGILTIIKPCDENMWQENGGCFQ